MGRPIKYTLVALTVAVLVYLLGIKCPGPPGPAPGPQGSQLAPQVITSTVTRFVVDSTALVRQRDSMNRVIRVLNRKNAELATALALADSAKAVAVDSINSLLSRDTVISAASIQPYIATILAAGDACKTSLANCEERATAEAARADIADRAVSRAYKRAKFMALVAVGLAVWGVSK